MVRCNALYFMLVCEALLAVLFCYLYLDYKGIAERTQSEFDAYVSKTMVFEEYLNSIRFTNYTVSNDLIEEGACAFADRTLTCNDEESRRLAFGQGRQVNIDYVPKRGSTCWGQVARGATDGTFETKKTKRWDSIGLKYSKTTYEGECQGNRCEIETEVGKTGARNVKVTTYPRWHWWHNPPSRIDWEVSGWQAVIFKEDQGVLCTRSAGFSSVKVTCKMNNSVNTYSSAWVTVTPF